MHKDECRSEVKRDPFLHGLVTREQVARQMSNEKTRLGGTRTGFLGVTFHGAVALLPSGNTV